MGASKPETSGRVNDHVGDARDSTNSAGISAKTPRCVSPNDRRYFFGSGQLIIQRTPYLSANDPK